MMMMMMMIIMILKMLYYNYIFNDNMYNINGGQYEKIETKNQK